MAMPLFSTALQGFHKQSRVSQSIHFNKSPFLISLLSGFFWNIQDFSCSEHHFSGESVEIYVRNGELNDLGNVEWLPAEEAREFGKKVRNGFEIEVAEWLPGLVNHLMTAMVIKCCVEGLECSRFNSYTISRIVED